MEVVNNIKPYALQQTQDNCDKLYKQKTDINRKSFIV